MKTKIAFVLLGIAITTLFSFTAAVKFYDLRNNTAEVEQLEGIYLFTDSKPVKDYDFLGTEKVGLTMTAAQYTEIRDKLIKKVKKEYPTANGIIFHFVAGSTDKADAIKFK